MLALWPHEASVFSGPRSVTRKGSAGVPHHKRVRLVFSSATASVTCGRLAGWLGKPKQVHKSKHRKQAFYRDR